MYIIKNQSNTITESLLEAATASLHDWLFEFKNEMTGEIKYCSQSDTSLFPSRYSEFSITDSTTENAYNGTLNFTPTGSWSFKIYEMPVASPPSLTTTGYLAIVKTGSLTVYDSTENVNINFNAEETKSNGVFNA
jgi:hypothetical protein